MDLGLKGKTALVTASSKGMGRACALGLAAEGARVVMCARTEADLQATADDVRARTGAEVLALPADVTRETDVKNLVARATERFGGVDILIANAGGPPRGNFDDVNDQQWIGAFEVSVLSVVRLIRAVLPSMRKKRWGRILTIQSVSVKQPVEGLLLSNAVRPGVAGMMKTMTPELGKDNITFNVLCPGRIMTERLLGGARQAGMPEKEYLEKVALDIPLLRVGTPEEFANVAVFLASERSSYVTGVALQIDGGVVRALL
ncbi:MAG: SDR family oxidoreductase [Candidatus Rokubacteria bacterium]|nr:SDR family oxidoreductase [Candidatus Rokubacteria bacterium]